MQVKCEDDMVWPYLYSALQQRFMLLLLLLHYYSAVQAHRSFKTGPLFKAHGQNMAWRQDRATV
jgi:hypothetical protein